MSEEEFKLKVSIENGEVHVHGNRAGLRDLAEGCAALSALSEEDSRTTANHVLYADYMNSAEDGSVPLMICLQTDL